MARKIWRAVIRVVSAFEDECCSFRARYCFLVFRIYASENWKFNPRTRYENGGESCSRMENIFEWRRCRFTFNYIRNGEFTATRCKFSVVVIFVGLCLILRPWPYLYEGKMNSITMISFDIGIAVLCWYQFCGPRPRYLLRIDTIGCKWL